MSQLKYHPLLIFSFKIPLSDPSCCFLPEKWKHEDFTLNPYFPDLCTYFLCNLDFPLPVSSWRSCLTLPYSGSFWESTGLVVPDTETLASEGRRLSAVQEVLTNGNAITKCSSRSEFAYNKIHTNGTHWIMKARSLARCRSGPNTWCLYCHA